MAEADVLLCQGQLRIRLGSDQCEDTPIDVGLGPEQNNACQTQEPTVQPELLPVSDSRNLPQQAASQVIKQTTPVQGMAWRRFPKLRISAVTVIATCACPGASVSYDMIECKAQRQFQGSYVWDKFHKQMLQDYAAAYAPHMQ